jgi:hypothetical protein
LKAGDRAFLPVIVAAGLPGGCLDVMTEHLDGSPGVVLTTVAELEVEKATPLCLAAPRLLAALRRLHALIDFGSPMLPAGTMAFGDPAEVNAAMAEALAAMAEAGAEGGAS